MEQNLSQKERKQRLIGGAVSGAISLAGFLTKNTSIATFFGIAALGLLLNYFTCFCGAKKALNSFKSIFT